MATLSPSSSNPQTLREAGASQVSLASLNQAGGEDWDRSMILEPHSGSSGSESSDARPSTPPDQMARKGIAVGTPDSGTKSRASLSELLRKHAEKGRELKLSDEDEERLSEELGNWINSDSSPYELDDTAEGTTSRRESTYHEHPTQSDLTHSPNPS